MATTLTQTDYQKFFKALLSGDSAECKAVVEDLIQRNITILEIYEGLFRQSLYQIGDLWSKGQLSVAVEHVATAIIESLISQLQTRMDSQPKNRKKAFVSCVTSDLHQIGARMVANLFELHGWESYFLGANMPVSELLQAIESVKPDVVCLSIVLIEHLKGLEVTVGEIRSSHPNIPILVGGGAFSNIDPSTLHLNQIPNVAILQSIVQLEQYISNFG